MTSSLVGSEMCIRDRSAARQPRVPSPAGTTATPRARTAGAHVGTHPVSYTHLTLPTICSV
eukprot:2575852-Prorocentrum_lima.AAC.1